MPRKAHNARTAEKSKLGAEKKDGVLLKPEVAALDAFACGRISCSDILLLIPSLESHRLRCNSEESEQRGSGYAKHSAL